MSQRWKSLISLTAGTNMSEHRVTRRSVEELAVECRLMAGELGLCQPNEVWIIEPGSPTYGHAWKLYAEVNGVRKKLMFTGNFDFIGKTARQARDFLAVVWEVLFYVQMTMET